MRYQTVWEDTGWRPLRFLNKTNLYTWNRAKRFRLKFSKRAQPIVDRILRGLCWALTGHSKGDSGYGGGEWSDRWCNWCDGFFMERAVATYLDCPSLAPLMTELDPTLGGEEAREVEREC